MEATHPAADKTTAELDAHIAHQTERAAKARRAGNWSKANSIMAMLVPYTIERDHRD